MKFINLLKLDAFCQQGSSVEGEPLAGSRALHGTPLQAGFPASDFRVSKSQDENDPLRLALRPEGPWELSPEASYPF
jgi:hypothetical protein